MSCLKYCKSEFVLGPAPVSPPISRSNYEHILFCTSNPVKQITIYLHFDHFMEADLLLHQEAYKVDSLQENGAHKQF